MIDLLQKIPVALPKPVAFIKKQQMLLTDIGGKWFVDKYESKLPPMKRPKFSKEEKKKENNIKQNL